jgi:hypothetical protein
MAVRRKVIRQRVGPALYQVMEPGDEIMAGMLAMAGLPPLLDMIVGLPIATFSLASISTGGDMTGGGIGFAGFLLTLSMQFLRRPVFVAVTQRQLICYRLARIGNEPVRLLFRAPLTMVRLTGNSRSALRWRSVRYSGPGAERGSLRLNVYGNWRQDLGEVMTALQLGGAAVEAGHGQLPLPPAGHPGQHPPIYDMAADPLLKQQQ